MNSALENIYISPLELCNLQCKYCYTNKTKNILKNKQILSFITHYQKELSLVKGRNGVAERDLTLKSIIFCGGEVFTLRNFPNLINKLIDQGIFITIITNGTIDRLREITQPQNCQLIVSFDGPREIHDQNRGAGNFDKSYKFVEHALKLGFPVEIFFLVTKDSYQFKDTFDILNLPKTYLVDRKCSLTVNQTKDIRQHYQSFPPKNFGCSMLSLQSDGQFYGCCESSKPIGSLSDPVNKIITNYQSLISKNPVCSDPDFFCNLQP